LVVEGDDDREVGGSRDQVSASHTWRLVRISASHTWRLVRISASHTWRLLKLGESDELAIAPVDVVVGQGAQPLGPEVLAHVQADHGAVHDGTPKAGIGALAGGGQIAAHA